MQNKEKPLAKVMHFDLQGKREDKYEFLLNNSIASVQWQELQPNEPNYLFLDTNNILNDLYNVFFSVKDLFPVWNSGLTTDRDSLFTDFEKQSLISRIDILLSRTYDTAFINKYDVRDSGSYKITQKLRGKTLNLIKFNKILYRPFDFRHIYYDEKLISRPAYEVMKFIVDKSNIGLIMPRQASEDGGAFITNCLVGHKTYSAYNRNSLFPLYLYPDPEKDLMYASKERKPNLNMDIVNKIAEALGLEFTNEKDASTSSASVNTFAPIDLLDYIYAVLHSPSYREKYKEFLKIDFPRVPYPSDKEKFWQLVKLGAEIRQIHLLESPVVENYITQYPEDGTNEVEKIKYLDSKVYINETQHFANVPEIAWNFYIGGYQPAQKWLKDRKGRKLDFDDILHYQKIIVALTETDRLMKEIDEIIEIED